MEERTVTMWDRKVTVWFQDIGPVQEGHFGRVEVHLPETLHQQLEGKKPLQIVQQGEKPSSLVFDSYDEQSNRWVYEGRFTLTPGVPFSLVYLHTPFCTWNIKKKEGEG